MSFDPRSMRAPRYGLLGQLLGANMNVTTDQTIAMTVMTMYASPDLILNPHYRIDRITVTNASLSLTTAAGGVYTATSKGGTAVVAAAQVYSALTTAVKALDVTIAVLDTRIDKPLYFSLTTAQGAAATADVYVWGWSFNT